jgi:hypothetical protein
LRADRASGSVVDWCVSLLRLLPWQLTVGFLTCIDFDHFAYSVKDPENAWHRRFVSTAPTMRAPGAEGTENRDQDPGAFEVIRVESLKL